MAPTLVLGLDFTSAPCRRKPLTLAECRLDAGRLLVMGHVSLVDYAGFEKALSDPGPWIIGIDFPFGQPREAVDELGWGGDWPTLAGTVSRIGKEGYIQAVRGMQARRKAAGLRMRPMRRVDDLAESCSPTQLDFIPVGRMFAEGAPRLLRAGLRLPAHGVGSGQRIAIEAYPAMVARFATDSRQAGYKNDQPSKQTPKQAEARRRILTALSSPGFDRRYGFVCAVPGALAREYVDDPTGDKLDGVLCAVQAAWAWNNRRRGWGMPPGVDPVEGWIHDPLLLEKARNADAGSLDSG